MPHMTSYAYSQAMQKDEAPQLNDIQLVTLLFVAVLMVIVVIRKMQ
jgi:hypothetical protein